MRYRDAAVGRRRDGGSDAGHLLKGNAMRGQQLQLLAAAAKQKRIAAFKAHHLFALQRLLQQNLIDLFLRHGMMICLFAHIDPFGPLWNQCQNAGAYQTVEHHHIGCLQRLPAFDGQQAGVAGSGADKRHFSSHGLSILRPFL